MKTAVQLGLKSCLLVAVMLLPVTVQAQEKKPAAVISFAKLDKILADIGYLTKAAGTPEAGGLVSLMAGPYLQGLDTKRPWGAYVEFAGPQPTVVVFLPVANLEAIIQTLENNNLEVEDAGNGLNKIATPQKPIYFREKNKWAFVSDGEDNLSDLPDDPSKLLGELPERYNLAFRVNVRNVPEELIDMATSEMKNAFERNIENESDADKRALQEKVGRQQVENMTRLLKEADRLMIGWGVDASAGRVVIDGAMTAVEGTKLADQMNAYQGIKSSFTGLELPDAAATLRVTAPVAKDDIEQAREGLKAVREQALSGIEKDNNLKTDEARNAAKEIVTSFFDVLIATMEQGKIDAGATILLEPKAAQFVAGGLVADGSVIEKQLKKLVDLAKESGDNDIQIENLKFNAAKHAGVDFHTFSVPVPEDEEDAREVFGEKLNVAVGTGKTSAYVSLGKDSTGQLKRVIDASASGVQKEVLPMQLRIALAPILAFAASLDDSPQLQAMASSIQKVAGKDHISVTQRTIPRGTVVRFEVEEGVLSLIGAAAKAQQNRNN